MEQHHYPLRLTTEASIDLADDPELLDLMYRANFRSVFIGIETPRLESLKETKKFQNVRGDSLAAKLARIQDAGLDINAGFIVGFDSDDKEIFEDQFRFIQDNGITLAMVGMLQAIPRTPLYERLQREGRLVEEDPNCNFIPKQMTRDELRQGYWDLVKRLYTPEAFLDRYFKVFQFPEYLRRRAEICRKAGEGKTLPTLGYGLALLWSLFWALWRDGSLTSVGWVYLKYFFSRNVKYRRDIIGFAQFMNRCVTHWHFYRFTREAIAGRLRHLQQRVARRSAAAATLRVVTVACGSIRLARESPGSSAYSRRGACEMLGDCLRLQLGLKGSAVLGLHPSGSDIGYPVCGGSWPARTATGSNPRRVRGRPAGGAGSSRP